MVKDELYINRDTLERLGVDPENAIKYLESISIKDLRPVHVKAHQFLKLELVSS